MKKIISSISLSCIISLIMSSTANAWTNVNGPVIVDTDSGLAYGNLHDIRLSSGAPASIGCDFNDKGNTSLNFIFCHAKDNKGNALNCIVSGSNLALRSAVTSLNGARFIQFRADTNGHCAYLTVDYSSHAL